MPNSITLCSVTLIGVKEDSMNPFKYGRVVSEKDFCPRPELLDGIKGHVRSGQNILVQGERRTGKTSLIYEAVRQIKKIRLLYIDILEIKAINDLCKRIVRAVATLDKQDGFMERMFKSIPHLRPTLSIDPITGQPSISIDSSEMLQPDSIEGLMDLILKVHKNKPVCVVFDEFQDVLNLKDSAETLAVLRSKIQFHNDICYVFAGSIRNKMNEIFNYQDSAFFKSAITINIGPIEEERFRKFLIRKFTSNERKINGDTLRKVFEIANDTPGDVQQLCNAMWEITSPDSEITDADIPEALNLIYARESKGYETALVQVTGLQLRVLVGLAGMGGESPLSGNFLKRIGGALPSSVKKSLDRLMKLQIVYSHEGDYKFVNPFFKWWLIYKGY